MAFGFEIQQKLLCTFSQLVNFEVIWTYWNFIHKELVNLAKLLTASVEINMVSLNKLFSYLPIGNINL